MWNRLTTWWGSKPAEEDDEMITTRLSSYDHEATLTEIKDRIEEVVFLVKSMMSMHMDEYPAFKDFMSDLSIKDF